MTEPISCFILAAGRGERMRPLTNHIPKPFLPIAGVPLIELIIGRVRSAGINKIGVNSHHLHEYIADWAINAEAGRRVTLFHEEAVLDTGGGLKNAARFLEGSDFLVHNGDIISDIDLAALIDCHRTSGRMATLAVHDCPRFNNLLLGGDGLLKAVVRGGHAHERLLAFTGIAVYSPDFLNMLPDGRSGLVSAWERAIDAGHAIGVLDVSGSYWNDIGAPAAYVSAVIHELGLQGELSYVDADAKVPADAGIEGHVIIERHCKVGANAFLKNCLALPGAVMKPGEVYENCIIGPDYVVPVDGPAFAAHPSPEGALIGTGGSDRKYFRVGSDAQTAIRMACRPDDPDYSRHIDYTLFFRKYGIPVPGLISYDPATKSALFEDLGDISLYTWLKFRGLDKDITEQIYRKVLTILALLHCEVSDHVSECPALEARIFDYEHLRWETEYFITNFIKGLMHIDIAAGQSLDEELHCLAAKTDAFEKRIIHRDFQSQNIMITNNSMPHIIDFQGARMAPPAYDIASVLWDPYAPLGEAMRERLLAYYMELVAAKKGAWFDSDIFMDSLVCCRLQRHMQALGAYGFLSTVKGKTYFMKFAPEGLRLLRDDISAVRTVYPALYELICSVPKK